MISPFRRRALLACLATVLLGCSTYVVPPGSDPHPTETVAAPSTTTPATEPDRPCQGDQVAEKCQETTTTTTSPVATVPEPGANQLPGVPVDFPNEATTGVPAGWQPAAVHHGDLWIREAGAVVTDLHVTGMIHVRADDVTIRTTKADGGIWNQESDRAQYHGLLIEDSTVGPDTGVSDRTDGIIGTSGYVARRVKIQGVTDGFRVAGDDVLIVDSFVRLSDMPGSCPHLDGVQGYGAGDNIVVHGNTIDARGSCSTAAVFMASASPHIDLQDNLLLGGAYTILLNQYEVPTNFVSTGNRVVLDSYDHGPAKILDSGDLSLTCEDNHLVTVDDDYQVTEELDEIPC